MESHLKEFAFNKEDHNTNPHLIWHLLTNHSSHIFGKEVYFCKWPIYVYFPYSGRKHVLGSGFITLCIIDYFSLKKRKIEWKIQYGSVKNLLAHHQSSSAPAYHLHFTLTAITFSLSSGRSVEKRGKFISHFKSHSNLPPRLVAVSVQINRKLPDILTLAFLFLYW